ncbi:MAG: hypothetical protein OXQ29_26325 [Rhodospirillaceae bacterium]|nr:hypothetical protein [Rhodospirillaceae bacterium]
MAAVDLKSSIAEGDVIVRVGPDLTLKTRGGDTGARYTRDAPADIQLDIPVDPADENLSNFIAASASGLTDLNDEWTLSFEVPGKGTGKKGLKIAGEVIVGQIEINHNPGTGDSQYMLPLRQVGEPLVITFPAAT